TGLEKQAFADSVIFITDSLPSFSLRAFKPEGPYKFMGLKHQGPGRVQMSFSRPVPGLRAERLNSPSDDSLSLQYFNEKKDSLSYWFRDTDADSIAFYV